MRLAAESPERFSRIILSNGGLPDGAGISRAFRIWRAFARYSPVFPTGRIVQAGTKRTLSSEEVAAYNAPFPAARFKAAARAYPALVPVAPDIAGVADNKRAWEVFRAWDKPFICAFSDGDPITRGAEARFRADVPGTKGQPHKTLKGGHFIQEDDPAGFAKVIVAACANGGAAT